MTAKLSAAQRNDNYTAAVAETLRAERAAAGLTIPELADRAGMVAVTLQRVLKAERDITVAQLAALAPVLGMTPSKLLAEAERPDDSQRSGEHRPSGKGVRAGAA
jgi:transcriptional regulator with XRE-family HTH domain